MSEPNGSESRLDRVQRMLDEFVAALQVQRVNIESLHANIHELVERSQWQDGRIAALIAAAQADGENIRALARIAESHERRLEDLEGGE
jgi:septal ring factor EnvC (AmiA/AmiB activator)